MTDYLFAMWEGGGNTPPQLAIVRTLVARGHRVRVLADRALAADVAATGAEHVPWTTAPQRVSIEAPAAVDDVGARTPAGAFKAVRDGLICGPADRYAGDVRAEVRRRRPDAIVSDFMIFGAAIAAEAEGLPCVALSANVVTLPGWGAPPLGPGVQPLGGLRGRLRDGVLNAMSRSLWNKGTGDVNRARTANGLAPIGSVLEQFARVQRLLILTSSAFEYPEFAPPAHVRIAGPQLDDPAWAEPWAAPAGDEPLVLVALSTTDMRQEDLLRRAAAALGDLPVRGLITTGREVEPLAIPAPPNVTVVRSAPHREVLGDAAAVVTHAGHGTVIKALAAGVPLVCLPMGRDQLDNAARVVHAGAGLRLKPSASPAAIAKAVRRALDEPAFAAAAGRIAGTIAEEVARDAAIAEIESIAGNGAGAEAAATARG